MFKVALDPRLLSAIHSRNNLYNSCITLPLSLSLESDVHRDFKSLCRCLKLWWHMALSAFPGSLNLGNKVFFQAFGSSADVCCKVPCLFP